MNEITIETPELVEEKSKTRKARQKEKIPLCAMVGDDNYIILDEEFSWSRNLPDAQKLFVYYYAMQSSLKKNGAEAARKAGYSEKTAKSQANQLLKNPKILQEIKNISTQITSNLTKLDLELTVKDIIERKKARLRVNPLDFYDFEKQTTENGYTFTSATPKLPEDLTPEQKSNIVDVEFVGQRGLLHFKVADAIQAENELLKIYKDFMYDKDEQKDGYEVETTAEIIKGNLQVKTKVIHKNAEIAELSELKNNDSSTREEED